MDMLSKHPLARKIALVTAIKAVALLVIWLAFFSGARLGGMAGSMPADRVAAAGLHSAPDYVTKP